MTRQLAKQNNGQDNRQMTARKDKVVWQTSPNASERFIQVSLDIILLRVRNPLESGMALQTIPLPPPVLKSNTAESRYRPK